MKAASLAVFLFVLVSLPASAQDLLMEAVFLPPRFFVGDQVELRLSYDVAAGLSVQLPAHLPEHEWIEIRDIEIQDRRSGGDSGAVLVRIFFIPFYSGETVLQSIRFGELDTGELLVSTHSALDMEQDKTLRGPRRQLRLPLTWLRLLTLVAIALGTPLCLYFLLRYGIRGLARIRAVRIRRLPYLHARKSLNQLAAATLEGKPFFILLSMAIRRYLSERLSVPLMGVTTGEIPRELSRVGLEDSISRRVHEILKAADLIKFSGKRANKREMQTGLQAVAGIVEQVEERTANVGT